MSSQEKPNCGSFGSLIRRQSSGISQSQMDENDIVSESVSEAGDIGDRAVRSLSNNSFIFSHHLTEESGVVVSRVGEDPEHLNSPLPVDLLSPLSTDAMVLPQNKLQNDNREVPKLLEYASCLAHLAVFGILGVLTRYALQKLFGPGIAGVTSNDSILYLDLPSNMVGSFLMGWFGVVFKGDLSRVSEFLAIGLSTGYLGSLTTFSGWNQKMLELSVEGHWVSSILGFHIGLFLAAYSIIFGVETAKGFRKLLEMKIAKQQHGIRNSGSLWRVDSRERQMSALVIFILVLGLLWGVSGVLLKDEFSNDSEEAQLWLGCLVGPLGVWIRWFLARLNGRGLGKAGHLKWIPFGTLAANVSASCVMAALATTRRAVNTKACNTITTGIQFGFMGCLSTVSTFIAEFNAMRESRYPWRAYAYAMITICYSFVLGTLIFSVPVWAKVFK